MKLKRKSPRGFSLIEALTASAILIVGLTGITMMLARGATSMRNGQQSMDSSQVVTGKIAEFEAGGFDNLVLSSVGASFDAGSADDGGMWVDASGRTYTRTYIVTDITATLPSPIVQIPTYQIDVEVSYRDGNGIMVYKRGGTIMSRAPDAGP